jgi:hypothetical protein
VPRGLVTEAEGFKLHLSTKSASGYMYVTEREDAPGYKAEVTIRGARKSIGTYSTAVEAAVAVARRVEDEPDDWDPPAVTEVHRDHDPHSISATLY